jgi:hypothetical protein
MQGYFGVASRAEVILESRTGISVRVQLGGSVISLGGEIIGDLKSSSNCSNVVSKFTPP